MKKIFLRGLVISLAGVLFSAVAAAQDARILSAAGDKYVISARAGGVNFVEGEVTIVRKAGKTGFLLRGDQVEIGDRIAAGGNGKAEILLNPGSYVRIGSNSTFEFITTSLDDLQLKVGKGSAIFEVFASDEFKVSVAMPNSGVELVESGIYRVDVAGDGGSNVSVTRGRAIINDNAATVVKKGRQAAINGGQVAVAKYKGDDRDEFDVWSKGRAKELARISEQFERDAMRTALMRSFLGNGRGYGWNMYNSFGLWAYHPYWRSYCFMPFGYGWNSPYGYGFGPGIQWYNLPPVIYMPPPGQGGAGGGGGTNIPTGIALGATSRGGDGTIQTPTAPFIRMQGDTNMTGKGASRFSDNNNSQSNTPTYTPPTSDTTSTSSSGGSSSGGSISGAKGGSSAISPSIKEQ